MDGALEGALEGALDGALDGALEGSLTSSSLLSVSEALYAVESLRGDLVGSPDFSGFLADVAPWLGSLASLVDCMVNFV